MDLASLKLDLVTDLEAAGLRVFDHVPEQISPPVVLVSTGDPYITEPDEPVFGYGLYTAHLELFLVVGTATNRVATTALDTMIQTVAGVIERKWGIPAGFSAPYMASHGGNAYLTSRVGIRRNFDLEGVTE